MNDIRHKLTVNGEASEVWDALSTQEGLSSWWTSELSFTPRVGGEASFSLPGGTVQGSVVGFEPQERLHLIFKRADDMKEWLNTELIITLEETDGEHTAIRLYHKNWLSASDSYMQWNYLWALLLRNLELYIEEATSKTVQDL